MSEKRNFIWSVIMFAITLIVFVLGLILKKNSLGWSWYFLMTFFGLFWLYRSIKDGKIYDKSRA